MKAIQLVLFIAALAFLTAQCTPAPESDEAEVDEEVEIDEEATATAASYTINPESSQVTWVGTKPTGRHNGTIGVKEGVIKVENGNVVGGNFTMDITTLKVKDIPEDDENHAKLTGHLKSDDFFKVDEYPAATFEIASVEPYEAGEEADEDEDTEFKLANPTHTVTGNLTLRGETKSISFPARINVSDDQVDAEAKFNIDRTQWGLSYNAEGTVQDNIIHNKVNVGFDIEAAK